MLEQRNISDKETGHMTDAFSQKLDKMKAAVSLHFACYNFVRVHKSLRVTPAMEAGIANHVWTIKEPITA
jgi:hypothetical protein